MQKKSFEVLYIAAGDDMIPSISPQEKLLLEKLPPRKVDLGDVIVFRRRILIAHRVVEKIRLGKRYFFFTKGDRCLFLDPPVMEKNVVGRVVGKSSYTPVRLSRLVALRILLFAFLVDTFFRGRLNRLCLRLLKLLSRKFP